MNHSFSKLVMAGFMATLAMAVITLLGNRFGFPMHFWANTLSDYLGHNTFYGYVGFFVSGVVFAFVYVRFIHNYLPSHSWQQGMIYGVMMWITSMVALAPALHMGFFMGSMHTAFMTLFAYLGYGAILGYMHEA